MPPLLICIWRVATPMLLLIRRIIGLLLMLLLVLLLLISSPGSRRLCVCIIARGVLHIAGAIIVSVDCKSLVSTFPCIEEFMSSFIRAFVAPLEILTHRRGGGGRIWCYS